MAGSRVSRQEKQERKKRKKKQKKKTKNKKTKNKRKQKKRKKSFLSCFWFVCVQFARRGGSGRVSGKGSSGQLQEVGVRPRSLLYSPPLCSLQRFASFSLSLCVLPVLGGGLCVWPILFFFLFLFLFCFVLFCFVFSPFVCFF